MTDTQTVAKHTTPNDMSPSSRVVLMRDVRRFKREVAHNYKAMFHEPVPLKKPSYAFFVWLMELFDKDKQFTHELDDFLLEYEKKANKRGHAVTRKSRRS